METFLPILKQTSILFAFIVIGFILAKTVLPKESAKVLSLIENTVLVPALVMGAFIDNCTRENIKSLWKILAFSIGLFAVILPLSIIIVKFVCKGEFLKKASLYGLTFSNFGFMGNSVVNGVFGKEIFFKYTVFTLPFWLAIYAWGVPFLLIPKGENKKVSVKAILNPMFIAMIIGLIIGLSGLKMPAFIKGGINSLGNCMSPVAMLLTGITVAGTNVLRYFKKYWLYLLSAIRLIIFPLTFILLFWLLPDVFPKISLICAFCMLAMPMGLNPVVVPMAYGQDTSEATALAIFTHVLSVVTIPLMYMLFNAVVL